MRAVESMRMYAILNSTLAYELDPDGKVTGESGLPIFNLVQSLIRVILRTKLNYFFNVKKYLDALLIFLIWKVFFLIM